MKLAVISRQFAKEFRVILNEARQAVLHASDILSETLTELVVDALVLLLNGPVEIARQSECEEFQKKFRGTARKKHLPLAIELRLAVLICRFEQLSRLVRHRVTIIVSLASILLQFGPRKRQVCLRDVQFFDRGLPENRSIQKKRHDRARARVSKKNTQHSISRVTYVKDGLLLIVELLQLLAGLLLLNRFLIDVFELLDIAGDALVLAHQNVALRRQQVALQPLNLLAVLLAESITTKTDVNRMTLSPSEGISRPRKTLVFMQAPRPNTMMNLATKTICQHLAGPR